MFNSEAQQRFARKLIRPFSSIRKQDVENEVRALDKLCTSKHPNIVQVLGHGKLKEDGAFVYIDMELCDITLERYIGWEQVGDLVNWETIIHKDEVRLHAYNIMRDILRGLLYIHSLGEVHRDLNPRNG
jgi:serine/threonine protein kinase